MGLSLTPRLAWSSDLNFGWLFEKGQCGGLWEFSFGLGGFFI